VVLSGQESPRTVLGSLKDEARKLPASVMASVVVALVVATIAPVRDWLLGTVQVKAVVLVIPVAGLAWVTWVAWRQRRLAQRLRLQVGDLTEIGRIDPLTKTLRKSEIEPALADRCRQGLESNCGFAVLFIDIDNFKSVNDTHTHDAGDYVLKQLGETLAGRSRGDLVFRYGGDEFVVITKLEVPDDALSAGYGMARRLWQDVAEQEFLVDRTSSTRQQLTISCGVTDFGLGDDAPRAMMQRADRACKEAKELGGNRVQQSGFVASE